MNAPAPGDGGKKPEKRPKDSEFFELPPNLKGGPDASPPLGTPAVGRTESGLRPGTSLDLRALIALLFAVVGVPASWPKAGGLLVPAAAVVLGVLSLRAIGASGGKLVGTQLARSGAALGGLTLLVMGLLRHAFGVF